MPAKYSKEKHTSFGYVERTIQGRIVEWINQIIKEENLPFDRADPEVEINLPSQKIRFPDIVIWKERGRKAACLISLKQPFISPYTWDVLIDAQEDASMSVRIF